MNEKVILCDMDLSQLTEYMTENFAVKPFVAGQLYSWLIKGADFADMTNLSQNAARGAFRKVRCTAGKNSKNADGGGRNAEVFV